MSSKIILPTYLTKQPSTGKQVKFRPFTVKEEKSLLLALQENNIDTVKEAIKNVISVCTDGAIDPETTPYYDIEYLYLQIRSKSVGEIIELIGSCECGTDKKTEFSADIADAVVTPTPTGNINITIPDTPYTITFRHPSIDDIVKTLNPSDSDAEEVVANCIVKVFTDEEVMDWSYAEKLLFVGSMTTKQQRGITEFLKVMPMCKLSATYTCKHCKKVHDAPISGFESFFV
jgi:T4 bacteriophage base plate protein